MPEVQRPTLRSRRLGLELRRIRESMGLSTHAAGRLLNRTQSSLSKLETGHRGIRVPALLQILDAYGVKDPKRRADLIRLAKEARKTGWWQSYEGMLTPEDMDLIGLEAEALEICYFELILIPGLFQTEDYARALMSRGPFADDPERIERLVAVRLRRQAVLEGADSPVVHAVLDEAALRRQVGGADFTALQLRHLLALSYRPNVILQVLPFDSGAYRGMGMTGPFLKMSGEDLVVVATESLTGVSYHEATGEIGAYTEAFERLEAAAASEAESRALIGRLLSSS